MTTNFVPFEGTLTFEIPETIPYRHGAIIFQKSNPSDLPENDDTIEIPIEFK
jgi:benzoyl-CoA reductase/2-hydroxyglutaryl-CoA dehydratase subunit BcrC/BadD/HgdB